MNIGFYIMLNDNKEFNHYISENTNKLQGLFSNYVNNIYIYTDDSITNALKKASNDKVDLLITLSSSKTIHKNFGEYDGMIFVNNSNNIMKDIAKNISEYRISNNNIGIVYRDILSTNNEYVKDCIHIFYDNELFSILDPAISEIHLSNIFYSLLGSLIKGFNWSDVCTRETKQEYYVKERTDAVIIGTTNYNLAVKNCDKHLNSYVCDSDNNILYKSNMSKIDPTKMGKKILPTIGNLFKIPSIPIDKIIKTSDQNKF